MNKQTIYGFKAFDKNLRCRDFQYEIGGVYRHEGDVEACKSGFHFCENPLDVLSYYPPTSRFARVVGNGGVTHGSDSKVATGEISVVSEISLAELIQESVKWVSANSSGEAATTGDNANAATTGDGANAATTGDGANAATTGNSASAATTGENSVSAAIGIDSSASGALGSWITVAEWEIVENEWIPKEVKSVKIDGTVIKPFVKYKLKGGQFVEAE